MDQSIDMQYTVVMVIGIDGSRAFTKNRTGTENYSYQLIRHMADNFSDLSEDLQFVIYLRPGNKVESSEWPANFKFKKITNKYLWTQLGLAWATFTDQLDLLFVPAHTIPLIRRPGLKTVMTVHDLGAEYLPADHQLKQRLYLGFITQFQLRSARQLIAVSEATKADVIKRLDIPSGRISVIYEGLNPMPKVKKDLQDGILNKFDVQPGKYFFFIGTIQPRKNLAKLMQAFSQFTSTTPEASEMKLVLSGADGWDYQAIHDLPQQLGIQKRVIFTGRVDDQQMTALYQSALALTYPSLFEGFGLPILEAFAAGCPVLTSNLSSMPEVAGKAAILVNPENTKEITEGMKSLLSKQVRQKLIDQGYKQVSKFSWNQASLETLELLIKVGQSR